MPGIGWRFFTGVVLGGMFLFFLFVQPLSQKTVHATFLIIPKSEMAAMHMPVLVETLAVFADSERLFKRAQEKYGVRGDWKAWDRSVHVSRKGNSGAIVLSISHSDEKVARILLRQSTAVFVEGTSQYYNVKEDIDIRVLEYAVWGNASAGTLSRGAIGLLGVLLFLLILDAFRRLYKMPAPISEMRSPFSVDKKTREILEHIPSEKDQSEKNISPEVRLGEIKQEDKKVVTPKTPSKKPTLVSGKRRGAPGNLPVGDISFLFPSQKKPDTGVQKIEPKKKRVPSRESIDQRISSSNEPSEEELKVKLNRLIHGDL